MKEEEDNAAGRPVDTREFFENALCGFVIADATGKIIKSNATIATWVGCAVEKLQGKQFSDLLSIGGRIYFETHLRPLLRMQGFFDEVALELQNGDERLPVLLNAVQRNNASGEPEHTWFTVLRARDRRTYEQNLKDAKTSLELRLADAKEITVLREQFIAVLGHDLRNPLGSILAGSSLLLDSSNPETDVKILQLIHRSSLRMSELISNIMDFARTRLGEGIVLNNQPVKLDSVLLHVIDELRTMYPARSIQTSFSLSEIVMCDAARIAQLLSNLVANAITHGFANTPVFVNAEATGHGLTLSVSNSGNPIPYGQIDKIFEPFSRESHRPSQNGVGLGLYIASQIATAHNGQLTVDSTEKETRFTLYLPG